MCSHVLLLILYISWGCLSYELYPYTDKHGSPRSHREIRECHETQGRDEIFEVSGAEIFEVSGAKIFEVSGAEIFEVSREETTYKVSRAEVKLVGQKYLR